MRWVAECSNNITTELMLSFIIHRYLRVSASSEVIDHDQHMGGDKVKRLHFIYSRRLGCTEQMSSTNITTVLMPSTIIHRYSRVSAASEVIDHSEQHIGSSKVKRLHYVQQSAGMRWADELHQHDHWVDAVHHYVKDRVRGVVHNVGGWNVINSFVRFVSFNCE